MMDFSTLIDNLKLPLIGGALLSLSSMNLMLDFSKVFGCSQSLKTLQQSYKLLLFRFSQNSTNNGHTNILFNSQNLFIATGLFLMGSILRLFMNFIDRNLSNHESSIFDSSVLSNHVDNSRSDDHHVLNNLLLFTLAGLLSGAGTTLASGCTSGHMLCGMARGSKRSIVATCVFFPVAILTHRVLKPLMNRIGAASQHDSMYQEFSHSVSATTSFDRIICGAIFTAPFIAYLVLKLLVTPDRLVPLRLGLLGATFGSGLTLSGMTKPSVVLGFFNFPLSTWDPSLLGVAIAGLGLNTLVYWVTVKPRIDSWLAVRQLASSENASGTERPLLDKLDRLAPPCATPPTWQLPEMTNNEITARLVLGSVLFGLGWGFAGVCPGPALVVFGAYPFSFVMWGWLLGFFAGSHAIP
ncbi:hypothetical protein PTTG_11845 [Puccinia triticina 1-1 BBBD Race 1]|uniref:Sulphur transport domain-containing protein n=1 Tax=Puccinia triticina (isolate 1-1 / race 1 (BBBD)) TaxID=630390 RepID=A0A180GLM3_PUCT1|nr:hypothetical protein PTTG_11845 [Puccinia triticina 1-1 BBBD Race 1]